MCVVPLVKLERISIAVSIPLRLPFHLPNSAHFQSANINSTIELNRHQQSQQFLFKVFHSHWPDPIASPDHHTEMEAQQSPSSLHATPLGCYRPLDPLVLEEGLVSDGGA